MSVDINQRECTIIFELIFYYLHLQSIFFLSERNIIFCLKFCTEVLSLFDVLFPLASLSLFLSINTFQLARFLAFFFSVLSEELRENEKN